MNWTELEREEQVTHLCEESKSQAVLIFKHSTRCSISATALNRLERNWKQEGLAPISTYFLDLIAFRHISNRIAEIFDVMHESPQLLLVQNGKASLVRSHLDIRFEDVQRALEIKRDGLNQAF